MSSVQDFFLRFRVANSWNWKCVDHFGKLEVIKEYERWLVGKSPRLNIGFKFEKKFKRESHRTKWAMFHPPILENSTMVSGGKIKRPKWLIDGWWMIHNQPTIILILLCGAKLLHMIDTLFAETHAFFKEHIPLSPPFPSCIWCVGSNSSKWLLKQHLDF